MTKTHFSSFLSTMLEFTKTLNRYSPHNVLEKIINTPIENLDVNDMISRYMQAIKPIKEKLYDNDVTIFTSPIKIFDGYNLSKRWNGFSSGQKKKVTTFMKLLYVQGELVLGIADDVNPFEGLGVDENEFSLDNLEKGIDSLVDTKVVNSPGLESIIEMTGLDKHIDIDGIIGKLNSMTDEDIENTTTTISKIFNGGDKMNTFIADVMNNVKNELSENAKDEGNKISDILEITNNVASKIKPNISISDIDIGSVIENLKKMGAESGGAIDPALGDKLNGMMSMMNKFMATNDPQNLMNMAKSMGMQNNPAYTKNPHNKKYVPKKKN